MTVEGVMVAVRQGLIRVIKKDIVPVWPEHSPVIVTVTLIPFKPKEEVLTLRVFETIEMKKLAEGEYV